MVPQVIHTNRITDTSKTATNSVGKFVDSGDHTILGGQFLNDSVAGFIYTSRDSQVAKIQLG